MGREIKFRVWDSGLKRFIYPEYLEMNMHGEVCLVYDNGRDVVDGTPNNEATIMQYTGLKDEEGTEIYDSDHLYAPGNLTDDLEYVGTVEWDNADARWEVSNLHGRFEYIPNGCVVRGHRYSELLEGN